MNLMKEHMGTDGRVRNSECIKQYFHYGCAALRCDSERWAEIVNDSAALRVAIDIETLSAFLYLSQRAAQRSAAVVETGL